MEPEPHSQTFDIVAMSRRGQRRIKGRRALQASAWGGVAAFGVVRGGVLGYVIAVYAADRALRVVTGCSLYTHVKQLIEQKPRGRFEGRRDSVDEASWQSFPASDPPGQGI
jgi:hypothetical protein